MTDVTSEKQGLKATQKVLYVNMPVIFTFDQCGDRCSKVDASLVKHKHNFA